MKPLDFKGKKITVMGLGTLGGGIGVVKYLSKHGADLTVTDIRNRKQLSSAVNKLDSKKIKFVLGEHRAKDFKDADLIIKNPAVPKSSKYLRIAKKAGVPIESDATLFFQLCPVPIIGVTGTKGKTTTVAVLEDIIKKSGKGVVVVGNNKNSVLDKLNIVKKDSIVIFELSSWRLEILRKHKLSPNIAVITNIAQDHLNTYSGMSEYVKAKSNIFAFQSKNDFVVLNKENKYTQKFGKEVVSRRYWFSTKPFAEENGIYVEGDNIIYRNMGKKSTVVDKNKIKLLGKHNLENILAAAVTAKIIKIPNTVIRKSVSKFLGVSDRLEFVRKYKGINIYNDTTATMPDATIAALRAFSEKVVLIAGGVDKNLDYTELANEIKFRTNSIVLIPGTGTEKIKKQLKSKKIEYLESKTLRNAVVLAIRLSKKGNNILFSPGAASFNMFKNEFDRGEKFKKIVKGLK